MVNSLDATCWRSGCCEAQPPRLLRAAARQVCQVKLGQHEVTFTLVDVLALWVAVQNSFLHCIVLRIPAC